MGHHPTFYAELALGLENAGFDVLALCPNPDVARKLVEAGRAEEFAGKGSIYFLEIEKPVGKLHWIRPRRIGAIYSTVLKFRNIERQIQREGQLLGYKTQAIFYSSIYKDDFEWICYASPFLRMSWTGIYLQASFFRMPQAFSWLKHPTSASIFSIPSCKSFGIFDESLVKIVAREIRKPVIQIPDPARARERSDTAPGALGLALRKFAAGRPIVGLLGHLRASKGVMTFIAAAEQCNPDLICFALVGEPSWSENSEEARCIRNTALNRQNFWVHLERIPTEHEFDGLVDCCDVLAATYIDFPHSSNLLAKAAVFEKPVIVSEGHLMADRVRNFRTGEIVEQSNVFAFLKAVFRITKSRMEWEDKNAPKWELYRNEHSFENFRSKIFDLVEPIFRGDNPK